MSWETQRNLGRHTRSGVDARGWLCEITRGADLVRVAIEISGQPGRGTPLRLPDDPRRALQNDGRTEVLKVLAQDEPPAFIHPGIDGCAYSSTAEPAADGEYVGRLDSRSEEGYFDWL
jgi:hypothetical protein